MKILHTSDWHIGRTLYGRKRYEEFSAFLEWLAHTIEEEKIDILLVAGDIFDTSMPSNRAQALYYQFLCRVAYSCCRHVVVIAGNHDSPSFLDAPKEILRALNVRVVGAITQKREDEVLVLRNQSQPELIVCAVPYLRDKDIRTTAAGETIDDKNAKLVAGLKQHYAEVCAIAETKQAEFEEAGYRVPIVGMGHLFTAGGKTVDGDGVRELYVGSLAHVNEDIFPDAINYLALGHLHVAQKVGGKDHIRYCGSPIPMGYGEAKHQKKVLLLQFDNIKPYVKTLNVPSFQALEKITGSIEAILSRIAELKEANSCAWLEVDYTGNDIIANLRTMLEDAIRGSKLEISRVKNHRIVERLIGSETLDETLDDLDVKDVFKRCLDVHEITEVDRKELHLAHQEIIQSLHEDDANAE